MEAALPEARLALEAGNLPIGAAIVHDNMIVALGRNAIDFPGDDTAHAELKAIQAVALFGTLPLACGAPVGSSIRRLAAMRCSGPAMGILTSCVSSG